MKLLSSAALMFAVLAFVSCTPAPEEAAVEDTPSTEAEAEAIRSTNDEYELAVMATDLDGWLAFWTDDAVWMYDGMAALTGKDASRPVFEEYFGAFTTEAFNINSEEIVVSGDWAYDRGTFTATYVPVEGGESVQTDAKYLVIMRRQANGSWQYARFISNSNTPPAEQ
jgi:uncharacterized protein (TIGR02246 family)